MGNNELGRSGTDVPSGSQASPGAAGASPPSVSIPNAAEHGLSGAAFDTLHCLWIHGPTFDGDVPSKSGRDELVERKLAMRHDGYQALTINGLRLGMKLGLDRRKERRHRELREKLANAHANAVAVEAGARSIQALHRATAVLNRVVRSTHSHIDGRDLLDELHPRKTLDIKRRVDARETWFEGDWLSDLWSAIKEAKAFLYSRQLEAYPASGIAARSDETAQQAQPEGQEPGPARGDAQ